MANLITIIAAALLAFAQCALAAEPRVITLSCNGTITDKTTNTPLPADHQPKPVEMGVVVNLDEQTVSFEGYVVPINSVDAAIITFGGEQVGPIAQLARSQGYRQVIRGSLDRVTGHMDANTNQYPTKQPYDPNTIVVSDQFDVVCKAAKPVF